MIKVILFSLVLLFFCPLKAEIKPEGTVLANFCGRATKQIEVCLADSSFGPEKSILILRNTAKKTKEFMLADRKNLVPEGMLGISKFSYLTSLFQKQDNYIIEKTVELKTTQAIYPNAPLLGELFINGKKIGTEFELEPMFHTL